MWNEIGMFFGGICVLVLCVICWPVAIAILLIGGIAHVMRNNYWL